MTPERTLQSSGTEVVVVETQTVPDAQQSKVETSKFTAELQRAAQVLRENPDAFKDL